MVHYKNVKPHHKEWHIIVFIWVYNDTFLLYNSFTYFAMILNMAKPLQKQMCWEKSHLFQSRQYHQCFITHCIYHTCMTSLHNKPRNDSSNSAKDQTVLCCVQDDVHGLATQNTVQCKNVLTVNTGTD